MKKNLLYLLIGISAFFASCQDPEGVGVDTSRQGITSLTAIFTSGRTKSRKQSVIRFLQMNILQTVLSSRFPGSSRRRVIMRPNSI